MLGALISAGASLAGGLLSARSTSRANAANEALQRDAAQNQVQWRVADANKAGVSPLVALGMSPVSMSPSHVGDTGLPSALHSMGQDVGRAVAATSGSQAKMDAQVKALTLEKMGLENQLLASQIRKLDAPGMVSAPGGDTLIDGQGDVPVLVDPLGIARRVGTGTPSQQLEDQYGESSELESGYRYIRDRLIPMIEDWEARQRKRFSEGWNRRQKPVRGGSTWHGAP